MAYILASCLRTHQKDEQGISHGITMTDTNFIITNIKKYTPKLGGVVYVANDPADYEKNDMRGNCIFDSLNLTGLKFKMKTILDNRNKKQAKEIIEKADLIILAGGRILVQNEFFKEIKLKELLKHHKGLIIGTSAGAMNLCKDIFNFPEDPFDMDAPRWMKGLGFFDGIVSPHFDGETKEYQIPCEEVDVINDWILPATKTKELIGIPNDSYILVDNGVAKFFGINYIIKNKKIERINTLKGCIVEESLKDSRMMNQFKITDLHISSAEDPKDRWHIYNVLIAKEQIKLLSKSMNDGKWYTHFWDKEGNITAVFSTGKTFKFNYNEKATWKKAVAHGLKMGIPAKQLDFLIN